MKVLRLHGGGDLRLHDEPSPVPGPGEVLLVVITSSHGKQVANQRVACLLTSSAGAD